MIVIASLLFRLAFVFIRLMRARCLFLSTAYLVFKLLFAYFDSR